MAITRATVGLDVSHRHAHPRHGPTTDDRQLDLRLTHTRTTPRPATLRAERRRSGRVHLLGIEARLSSVHVVDGLGDEERSRHRDLVSGSHAYEAGHRGDSEQLQTHYEDLGSVPADRRGVR